MKHLISNSLNEKSVINNIMANSLNNVILLTGPFGVGKTEFAQQIAKMLTCHKLTTEGYCGECSSCQSEIVHGIETFNNEVHLLNMEKVDYTQMQHLVAQCVNKLRQRNEVYILDEFHLVEKKSQELWLAETAKLDNCYIILTTTDRRAISDGITSRAVQISMKLLAPLEARQLIREHYPEASSAVVEAIIKKEGGSPRQLIITSQFYSNAGLDQEEIIDHLSNVNQQEIILCLESLGNQEAFFDSLRTVRTMNEYVVKKSLQDLLWDWLGATEYDRKNISHLARFNEKQIMGFLVSSDRNPFLTILEMFKIVNIRKPIREESSILIEKQATAPTKPEESYTEVKRW